SDFLAYNGEIWANLGSGFAGIEPLYIRKPPGRFRTARGCGGKTLGAWMENASRVKGFLYFGLMPPHLGKWVANGLSVTIQRLTIKGCRLHPGTALLQGDVVFP
ncbi:MAG: hypothetical protein C0P72_012045, partial [Clostridia bacterium]